MTPNASARPSRAHTFTGWLTLATSYAAAQSAIRAITAVSALILVNALPVDQYGIYTLLLATFGFLLSVTDFGATGSLLYFWRRAHEKPSIFAKYLRAVLRLRKWLFAPSAVIATGYVLVVGITKHLNLPQIAAGAALMLLAAWCSLQSAVWLAVLRIKGKFARSYAAEAATESSKLLGAIALWGTGATLGTIAMLTTAGAACIGAIFSKRLAISAHELNTDKVNLGAAAADKAVRGQVLPTAPWTLFFAAQGALLTWIAASFGSIQNLAEVGALGRLSALIAMISGFTVGVFVPKISRISNEHTYIRYYLLWWVVLLGMGGAILASAALFPRTFLFLLGKDYKTLEGELLISASTAVVMTFEYYGGAINRARGWIGGQGTRIGVVAAGELAMIPFLDFTRTRDILLFGLGTALLACAVQVTYNVIGLIGALTMRPLIPHPRRAK